jgi:hypothetical protein
MIAVNQEKINLKDKEDPFVKFYLEKTKFLKEKAASYSFRYPKEYITPADPYDKDSRPRQPTATMIEAKTRFSTGDFEVEVQYYKNSTLTREKVAEYTPLSIEFTGSMTLTTSKDLDLLFYMIYVCPHAAVMKDFPGQNNYRRRTHFELYDHVKNMEEVATQEEKLAEVKTAIWHSKFGQPVGKLRMFLGNMGVPGVEKIPDNDVRNAVDAKILGKVAGKYDWEVIEKFLKSLEGDDSVELGYIIQKAVDDAIITLVKASKNVPVAFWKYAGSDEKICEVGVRKDAVNALKDYLDRYPEQAKLLTEATKK